MKFLRPEDHHSLHIQANENASPHAQLLPGSWELHPKPLSAHFFGRHYSTVNGQMHEPALARPATNPPTRVSVAYCDTAIQSRSRAHSANVLVNYQAKRCVVSSVSARRHFVSITHGVDKRMNPRNPVR